MDKALLDGEWRNGVLSEVAGDVFFANGNDLAAFQCMLKQIGLNTKSTHWPHNPAVTQVTVLDGELPKDVIDRLGKTEKVRIAEIAELAHKRYKFDQGPFTIEEAENILKNEPVAEGTPFRGDEPNGDWGWAFENSKLVRKAVAALIKEDDPERLQVGSSVRKFGMDDKYLWVSNGNQIQRLEEHSIKPTKSIG